MKTKTMRIFLTMLLAFSFIFGLAPVVANAEQAKTMGEECMNFDFPTEEQMLEVVDYDNLTETEKVRLEEYIITFYGSFGCDTNNLVKVNYIPATETASQKSEVHVVFSDQSFHTLYAEEIMKNSVATEKPEEELDFTPDATENQAEVAEVEEKETECVPGDRTNLDVNIAKLKSFIADANNETERIQQAESLLAQIEQALAVDCLTQETIDGQSKLIEDFLNLPKVPVYGDSTHITALTVMGLSLVGVIALATKMKKAHSSN